MGIKIAGLRRSIVHPDAKGRWEAKTLYIWEFGRDLELGICGRRVGQ